MISVGIIGYGYWGPNLARNFAGSPGVRIAVVADPDPGRRAAAARDHPDARIEPHGADAVALAEADAIVIATPPAEHHALARAALAAGKHLFVEKPFTTSLAAAKDLVEAAEASNRVLMVDHTFVYAPAVETLLSIVQGGDIGEPVYVESTRTNLARFDPSIGVVRDLAIHDLAILDRLLGCAPRVLSTRVRRSTDAGPEDFAFIGLDYRGLPAHLHVNCLSPVKIRRMVIGGTRGLVIYDDVEPVEKIRMFQRGRGATLTDLRTGYRDGPVLSPSIPPDEPLARVAAHFVDCIRTGATPLTDGRSALRVLAGVEAAEQSIALRPDRVAPARS